MPKPTPPDKKPKRAYITLPDDFEIPATEDGKTFEAIAEIRKEPDGRYCVVALDGIPLKEDEEEGEPESLGAGAKNLAGGYG